MTKTMSLEEYEEYKKNSGASYTGATAGPTTTGVTYSAPPQQMSPMAAPTTVTYPSTTMPQISPMLAPTTATFSPMPTTTRTIAMSLEEYEEWRKKKEDAVKGDAEEDVAKD